MSLLTPKWAIEGLDTLYSGIVSNYTGQFDKGEMSGLGTIVYSNKRQYKGILEKCVTNGKGTMIYPDNSKHVGEWKNGRNMGLEYIQIKMDRRHKIDGKIIDILE